MGVFRETAPEEVDAYQHWLGCRVDYVLDYSGRDTWADIANPTYLTDAWKDEPRRLVLSVAMLPTTVSGVSMKQGAAGQYDTYFEQLAELLVSSGHQDTIVRIGWEFNISNSPWFTQDSQSFVRYWRRIVTAMSSVSGNRFEFDWSPLVGVRRVDAALYYPGDDVVDLVGVDVYDANVSGSFYPYPAGCSQACRESLQTSLWNESLYGGPRGLAFWRDFARAHGKPLSISEWGIWRRRDGLGGGDDPAFVRRMHAFIVDPANRVAYQIYFEYDSDSGQHRLMTTFQQTGVLFRKLFNTAP